MDVPLYANYKDKHSPTLALKFPSLLLGNVGKYRKPHSCQTGQGKRLDGQTAAMTRLESCEALYPRCRRLHGTNLRVESRESGAESVEERKANFANATETDASGTQTKVVL